MRKRDAAMRKDTYRIGDGTFAFSPAVFDSLLGHGAKGAARMRELAGAMHVSILHDIKVNPEDDKSRPPWEIGTEDLFLQTLDVYLRACRRATPYVGESDIFVRLLGLCDIMTETAFGEDDGKWLPDPDMIFDPHEDGYVSPMEAAELKCRKLLDEIRNDLLALRPTAGK